MTQTASHASTRCGTILVLNGASSSGKTSIARAMQRLLPEPWQHLQLDAFRAMEPPGYWDDEGSWAVRLAALCGAMNAALSAYSLHAQHVIYDTALSNRGAWRHLLEDLTGLPVLLVGVSCDRAELTRRELDRGDRPTGLAAGQADWIHSDKRYDCVIDTTTSDPNSCAAELVRWLGRGPAPQAFAAMQSTFDAA